MSTVLTIDKETFFRRIKRLYSAWKDNDAANVTSELSGMDALVTAFGADEDIIYYKTSALMSWLLGHKLTDTIMALCEDSVYFLASKKKIEFLKPLAGSAINKEENGVPAIKLLRRDKNDKDKANFSKLLDALKKSHNGKKVGIFAKDYLHNGFVDAWNDALKKAAFETVDVSSDTGYIMATKEDCELPTIRSACQVSVDLFNKHLKEEIIQIVDKDKKVKHSKLAEDVESAAHNKNYVTRVDLNQVDLCYPPIIQSGGNYSLKFSAVSDDKSLHYGAIVCILGARYKSYCSNIGRTLLVNPTKSMEETYEFLLSVEEKILKILVEGNKLSDVYSAAESYVKKERPNLSDKLTKTLGFATGIEFRERSLIIGPKNNAVIKKGMVFIVSVGFDDLDNLEATDERSKKYALFLSDTVLVTEGEASVLTNSKKNFKNLSFNLEDKPFDDDEEEKAGKVSLEHGLFARSKRSTTLANSKSRVEVSAEEKREKHQKQLAARLNEQSKLRLTQQQKSKTDEAKVQKPVISYKSAKDLPEEANELKIWIDFTYETVILPIYGIPVPFHVSTIKNISRNVDGDVTYLRINFSHPGAVGASSAFANPLATYLKELTYRSKNVKESASSNLDIAFRNIKDVQKRYQTREMERKEARNLVGQEALVVSRNKANNPKLRDILMRPKIGQQNRMKGTLEAHTNGLRYSTGNGVNVDILYSNIRHAIFQPCRGELVVLLHFHLKNAVMVGKTKRSTDVQFYTEVGETVTDLAKHRHDRDDDVIAEKAQRDVTQKLEMAFKSFCDKVELATRRDVQFDRPIREHGFPGAPFRSTVLLQPTNDCLVQLSEWPPFIVSLEDVELVHFERVQFQLKNFDMIFVFKDYHRKVATVSAVPISLLDQIKNWFDSCDIRYTAGEKSLNWPNIMKTITNDIGEFFEKGGWSFLDPGSASEAGSDSDEEEDDYVPSGADNDSDESDTSECSEQDSDDEESESDGDTSGGEYESDSEMDTSEVDQTGSAIFESESCPRQGKAAGGSHPPRSAHKRGSRDLSGERDKVPRKKPKARR